HKETMTPAVLKPVEIQFRRRQLRCSGKSTKFYQVSRSLRRIRPPPWQPSAPKTDPTEETSTS
ncbi:hypothetical protein ACPV4W_23120, partial [Vibrio diabolicus]|uniref:hypothetical protein n=1 Tax=Vibrio diabolicus TaxID=50719 RepID=UPI004069638B